MIKIALFWLIMLSIMALKRRDPFFNLSNSAGKPPIYAFGASIEHSPHSLNGGCVL